MKSLGANRCITLCNLDQCWAIPTRSLIAVGGRISVLFPHTKKKVPGVSAKCLIFSTEFGGSEWVAVALHSTAAARPWPSDPARARRGRGTRSCVCSAACAPHSSDAKTDATAGHLVARLVETRGAVMPTLRNIFTNIAYKETRPSCGLMPEKEISEPLRL